MKIIRILFFGILLVALVGLACSSGGGGGDDDDDSEESAESCVSGLSPVYSCESGEVGDLTPSQVDANTLCQDGEPRYTCAAQCGRTASTCAQVISCTQACFTPDFATSNFERCQEQAAELFGPSGCFQAAVYQRNLENSCILLGDVSEAEQQAYLRCLDRVINECGSYVEPEDAFTNGAGACVTEYLFVDSDDDDDDD
ncbi:MAG: hypothetical protein H6684_16965, partial [Deltaproteobacteria bacterium]|nr:hypothetical protein [Deltaproteobacteria bacterium]